MKFWVIVTVLFCASIVGGQVPRGLQNGTEANPSGCRMVYSFQSLDFENLKSSLNKLDRDQVFTGMAYDPHSGTIFLSSPKVSGRRAAVSYFRVDKYKPGTLPKLIAYPSFDMEPKCDKRKKSPSYDGPAKYVYFDEGDYEGDYEGDVDSVDQSENVYRARKLLSEPEEEQVDEDHGGEIEDPEPVSTFREARHKGGDVADVADSDDLSDRISIRDRLASRLQSIRDRRTNQGHGTKQGGDSATSVNAVALVLESDGKKQIPRPAYHDYRPYYRPHYGPYPRPQYVDSSEEQWPPNYGFVSHRWQYRDSSEEQHVVVVADQSNKKDRRPVRVGGHKGRDKNRRTQEQQVVVVEEQKEERERRPIRVVVNKKDRSSSEEHHQVVVVNKKKERERRPIRVVVNKKDRSSSEEHQQVVVVNKKKERERRPIRVVVNKKDRSSSEEHHQVVVVNQKKERRPVQVVQHHNNNRKKDKGYSREKQQVVVVVDKNNRKKDRDDSQSGSDEYGPYNYGYDHSYRWPWYGGRDRYDYDSDEYFYVRSKPTQVTSSYVTSSSSYGNKKGSGGHGHHGRSFGEDQRGLADSDEFISRPFFYFDPVVHTRVGPIDGEEKIPYPHVSVYAIKVDSCQRLWVLDTGVNEERIEIERCMEPSISIYDISSSRKGEIGQELLMRVAIPKRLYRDATGFLNFVVDSDRAHCDDAVAYIANAKDNTLLVHDFGTKEFRLFDHPAFQPEDLTQLTSFKGHEFTVPFGIAGLAIGSISGRNSRDVIFNPWNGQMHYAIHEKIRWTAELDYNDFLPLGFRGNDSVSPSSVFSSKEQVLLFGESNSNSIKCISVKKQFNAENIDIAFQDKKHLMCPHTMHLDDKDNLFVLSNEYPLFAIGEKRRSDLDYAIFRCDVKEMIRGTKCEKPGRD